MKVDSKTKVYGLFGYPVEHTFSPAMQNAAFQRLGLNSVYLAFEVRPSELGRALKGILSLGLGGVNLTIPHKEAAIPYLDNLSPEAELIGAVNTVVVRGGKLLGHNTDGAGFLASLKMDLRWDPKGKKVFILGAGGAGKAIAFELAKEGSGSITLADLLPERAKSLASKIRRSFPNCRAEAVAVAKKDMAQKLKDSDLFVNATPVGMRPGDRLPVDPAWLGPQLLVYDLIYNPLETKLIKVARARGIRAANGLGMLLYQGGLSFELWTHQRPPVEVMRKALLRQIKEGGDSSLRKRSNLLQRRTVPEV